MSDFNNIQSCHSKGGSYWACAVAEAQNGGAVVYMVKSKDLENVDINSDEIFTDPERGIEGLDPISRIRLRNFVLEETEDEEEYELAVPEVSTYGLDLDGFLEDITEWARREQLSDFEDEDGIIAMPDIESFKIRGGSYTDNQGSTLLNNFFNHEFYRGDVENENEEESIPLYEQYKEEAAGWYDWWTRNSVRNIDISWEMSDDGDGEPYVIWNGTLDLDFPEDEDYMRFTTNELERAIDAVNEVGSDAQLDKYIATENNPNGYTSGYTFDITPDGDSMGHPDEFRRFIEYCLEIINVMPSMQKAWEKAYWEIKKAQKEEAQKEEDEWAEENKKADDSRND